LAAGGAFGVAPDTSRVFQAGAALYDITPEPGVSLAGHFHDRIATHAHDPLYARCLVLDDGVNQLALVMVDNCVVPRDVFDAARAGITNAVGIPATNIMMAATHTHTAPSTVSIFNVDPVPGYGDVMTAGIVEAVREAHHRLAPALIASGAGTVPDEVFNRRWFMKPGSIPASPLGETTDKVRMNPPYASEDLIEPAGPTDPATPFIAVKRPDGTPVAVLANYALHYVGGTDAGAMSADYFGCFADALTKLFDAADTPFVAMMSNGASGDINNINFREPAPAYAPYEKMNLVADKVAREVYRACQEAAYENWMPLGAITSEISLDVRRPKAEDVERAQAIVNAVEGGAMKSSEEVYARETLMLQQYPQHVSAPLQVLRIGDAAITAIPCEVFVEIGLHLKKESPFSNTFPVALANGYYGYLPTAAQHALGGYETWRARSSYLEVRAADKIQAKLKDMLLILCA
jgi:hypothetical protein